MTDLDAAVSSENAGSSTDAAADAKHESTAARLRGVSKFYGELAALDHVDLDVREGEFLSLLGPSGCGKTTLLRLLAGFEHPDTGDIDMHGISVVGVAPHKREVNTVFQAYALFPHMTVAENIAYGLRQRKVPRDEIKTRVTEALQLVRMSDFANRSPKQLSGGQQQRIALARAIVNRPKLLLLDEPMSALDRKLREQMQIELKLIQRQIGITFVFVTHDQDEALSMSDRIVVMHDGKIQQVGTPEEIYESPKTPFVAEFIGKQNFARAKVTGADKLTSDDGDIVPGSAALEPFAIGDDVLACVRAEAVEVSAQSQDADTCWTGELASVSFLGDVVQYVVLTGSGMELLARMPVSRTEPLRAGSQVWCTWSPESVHVFPADADGATAADLRSLAKEAS